MFFILENLRGERIFVVRSVGVNIKGSASQLNKLVLKDSPHIKKLSGTNLFPRSCYQYIYQLSKNPALAVSATTSGCEQQVVADTARGRAF